MAVFLVTACWAMQAFQMSGVGCTNEVVRRTPTPPPIVRTTPSTDVVPKTPSGTSVQTVSAWCLKVPDTIALKEPTVVVFRDFDVANKAQCFGVYENGALVMRNNAPLMGTVSTGMKNYETPLTLRENGMQQVLWAVKMHYSKEWDGASMPHTMWIDSERGIALHGGNVSRAHASHGCIRLAYGMAKSVFDYYHEVVRSKRKLSVIVTTDVATFRELWEPREIAVR